MVEGVAAHDPRKETAMLVLSRKAGERILIGEDIVINIVRIGPNTVKIGIEAPKSVNIIREELCETVGVSPEPGFEANKPK
jgi:carbon storage regulator